MEKILPFTLGLVCLLGLCLGRPRAGYGNCHNCAAYESNRPVYGPNVDRFGFCPINPEGGVCDFNQCGQDNHCESIIQKCCPGQCGALSCMDLVIGYRRPGKCPNFWEIKLPSDQAMFSECEIDDDCVYNVRHKCCGSEFNGIYKCVFPAPPEDHTEAPFEYEWVGAVEYDYAEPYGNHISTEDDYDDDDNDDGSDGVEVEDAEFGSDEPAFNTDFLDGNDEQEASVDNSADYGNFAFNQYRLQES